MLLVFAQPRLSPAASNGKKKQQPFGLVVAHDSLQLLLLLRLHCQYCQIIRINDSSSEEVGSGGCWFHSNFFRPPRQNSNYDEQPTKWLSVK